MGAIWLSYKVLRKRKCPGKLFVVNDTLIIYLPEHNIASDTGNISLKSADYLEDSNDLPDIGGLIDSPEHEIQHQVEWALLDMSQKRVRVSGRVALGDINEWVLEKYLESNVTKTIVLIPGSQVLLKEVSIPGKQSKYISKAVPYLLEDIVANDIEQNFFAIGDIDNNQKIPVAVVEKDLMNYWVLKLKQSDIHFDIITTDILMVPFEESIWTVILGQTSTWLRTTFNCGISVNHTAIGPMLDAALLLAENDSEEVKLNIIDAQNMENKPIDFAAWEEELQKKNVAIKYQEVGFSEFDAFCANYLSNSQIKLLNFCQGEFRKTSSGLSLNFNWKPIAILLVLFLVIQVGGGIFQKISYQSRTEDLKQQSIKLYRDYFPNDKRIVNIKIQTNNHLKKISGASGNNNFLPLVYDVGNGLKQMKGKTISLTRMSFDNKLGDLRLDLTAKDFAALEKYKQILIDTGLSVDISSAVAGDQGVQARVKIKSGNGSGGLK